MKEKIAQYFAEYRAERKSFSGGSKKNLGLQFEPF